MWLYISSISYPCVLNKISMFYVLAGGVIQLRLHCYGLLLGFVGGCSSFLLIVLMQQCCLFVTICIHFFFFLTEYYF